METDSEDDLGKNAILSICSFHSVGSGSLGCSLVFISTVIVVFVRGLSVLSDCCFTKDAGFLGLLVVNFALLSECCEVFWTLPLFLRSTESDLPFGKAFVFFTGLSFFPCPPLLTAKDDGF